MDTWKQGFLNCARFGSWSTSSLSRPTCRLNLYTDLAPADNTIFAVFKMPPALLVWSFDPFQVFIHIVDIVLMFAC